MILRSVAILFLSLILISGGVFVRSFYSNEFNQLQAETVQKNLEKELTKIEDEAKSLLDAQLQPESDQWDAATHFFIHADSIHAITWNRNFYFPNLNPRLGKSVDHYTFIQTQRGNFIVVQWTAPGSTSLFCILTLTSYYPIVNNFLSPEPNPDIFPQNEIQLVDKDNQISTPVFIQEKVIFKILNGSKLLQESKWSFALFLMGVALFVTGLILLIQSLQRRYTHDLAFLVLMAGLVGLRMGMISLSIPGLMVHSDLFDAKKFASSVLNASMGDLLLNTICLFFLVIYLFRNFGKLKFIQWLLARTGFQRWLGGLICILVCFFALLLPFNYVEAFYHNSKISLEIQSLAFDGVRIAALASVLLACVSSFLFIHVFFLLANHLFRSSREFIAGCILASIIFFVQFYGQGQQLWATLVLGIFFFTILKLSGLADREFRFSFQLFIYLIFSLFIFSIQNAWATRLFFIERQTQDQLSFGKDFLTDRDILGEYLMDQARQRIEADQFIQVRLARPFLGNDAVEDKIRRIYLSNYFDRYEVNIHALSQGFMEEGTHSAYDSMEVPYQRFLPTGYKGISYANVREGNEMKRYHMTLPVYYQKLVGFVTMDFNLKRVIPNNVYPELLIDNRFRQLIRNREFSYAIFSKDELISSFGDFNYQRDFNVSHAHQSVLFAKGLTEQGYFHVGIEGEDGSVAVVSATVYPWFHTIANIAFWFVIGLGFLFIGQGVLGVISILKGEHVNFSARIQLFIFLSFLLPVLAVSITTLTLIGRSNEETIKNEFLQRSDAISENLGTLLSNRESDANLETDLVNWIGENSGTSEPDISVYSPEGRLLATSQPALFDNQLISPLIHRDALKRILIQRETRTVTNEQIGKLDYSCAYAAVLSPETGKLEAVIGLPFFESAAFLQKSQSLILSNILVVFVVVFILFSLFAFFASSSLTYPIQLIARTLGQTTLSGQNKPLQWKSSDEIGALVKEYNRMVANLEESKMALAQSEKESAWREMAKQVAHEIKNPLTPMKLTLQQMELALKTGNLPVDRSQKSVEVLLKQVEILNEIAGSFSSFASMPKPSPKLVELNQFMHDMTNLFAADEMGKVSYKESMSPVMISVDTTSFSRGISNIIINALQARKDGQSVEVNMSTFLQSEGVRIVIQDNGKGMDEVTKGRVFQPQFTTKQSGSGLGLAMTRQIILQAGGKIWFESVLNIGTKFFIELPLAGQ